MTEMKGDIVNRVRRLPKPSTAAEALQPVFEAVSNAIQAIEDRYGDQAIEKGRVDITISNIKMPSSIDIYPAHARTRKSLGSMTRKLSVT